MVHKTYLAVVCATLFSVSFSVSLVADSGGSGKNKKTIIVHAVEVEGVNAPARTC
jgi:hypothetical protein